MSEYYGIPTYEEIPVHVRAKPLNVATQAEIVEVAPEGNVRTFEPTGRVRIVIEGEREKVVEVLGEGFQDRLKKALRVRG